MTTSCRDLGPLLAEMATGPLGAADRAAVDAHLGGCQACRAEAARMEEALRLARVAPAGAAEEALARDLARSVLAQARPRARAGAWRLALAAAAGAAVVLAVSLVPPRTGPAAGGSGEGPEAVALAAPAGDEVEVDDLDLAVEAEAWLDLEGDY
ncbi:MAG TPA: zf-HC2 domain-containing protein [Anaeromyxobacteraceae bacterium]|jgi:anti-sigma factor RsiW